MHTPEELNNLAISFQEFKQIYANAASNIITPEAEIERITGELVERLIKVFGETDAREIFEDTLARILAFYGLSNADQ